MSTIDSERALQLTLRELVKERSRLLQSVADIDRVLRQCGVAPERGAAPAPDATAQPATRLVDLRGSVLYEGDIVSPLGEPWNADQ